MTAADYDAVVALWRASPGIELNESDSRAAITAFLERNPELSAVALADATVVGAMLAGHDGRRGYLHHLAVTPSHRSRGIACALIDRALGRLAALGIVKCNLTKRKLP
jgi:ribosomal protein S18 acetylase RimI-like enzyme